MTELEKLKFNLKEKEDKLYSLRQNIFVLNPEIGNLVTQIFELKKEIKINLDSVSDSEQIDKIISQSKNQHNKFNSYQNYVNQNEDKVSFDLNITTTINNNSKNVIKRSITPTKRKKRNVSFDTTSNEIKSYLTEISNLKREISKLEKENNKLYKDLQTEREQNKKYRTLTEDIIKQFQKSKRTQLKK